MAVGFSSGIYANSTVGGSIAMTQAEGTDPFNTPAFHIGRALGNAMRGIAVFVQSIALPLPVAAAVEVKVCDKKTLRCLKREVAETRERIIKYNDYMTYHGFSQHGRRVYQEEIRELEVRLDALIGRIKPLRKLCNDQ